MTAAAGAAATANAATTLLRDFYHHI